jgi:hypothetical protein
MSFFVISIGDNLTRFVEVDCEEISSFLREERWIFSGKLEELPAKAVKDIQWLVCDTSGFGYAHVSTLIRLAGIMNRQDVHDFATQCQKDFFTEYLVGK